MVKSKEIFMTKLLLSVASLVVVVAGFKLASVVLIPIVFSIFLASFGLALIKGFAKIKVPKFLALIIVTLFMVLSFTLFFALLKNSIEEFTTGLPKYKIRYDEIITSLNAYLAKYNIVIPQENFSEFLTIENLMGVFLTSIKGIVGAISNTVIVLIMVLFILFESSSLEKKLNFLFENSAKFKSFKKTSGEIQKYILIKSITSGITGILIYFLTLFMGLDFPILWGATAFIFNYVPIIGSIVASIPAILLAIIQLGFYDSIFIAIGYLAVNWTVSYLIEPLMMGKNLGLSPLVVVLSVFFWGWLWGPAGALLSVPLAMVIKILFENSHDFYWIGIMMGDSHSLKKKITK